MCSKKFFPKNRQLFPPRIFTSFQGAQWVGERRANSPLTAAFSFNSIFVPDAKKIPLLYLGQDANRFGPPLRPSEECPVFRPSGFDWVVPARVGSPGVSLSPDNRRIMVPYFSVEILHPFSPSKMLFEFLEF